MEEQRASSSAPNPTKFRPASQQKIGAREEKKKAAARIDTESRYKAASMRRGPNALGIPIREAHISGASESTPPQRRGQIWAGGRGMAHLAADAVADAVVLLVGVAAGLGHRGGQEEPAARADEGWGAGSNSPPRRPRAGRGRRSSNGARGATEPRAPVRPESSERSPAGSCAAARTGGSDSAPLRWLVGWL
jgi:hypothetical protein